MLFLSIETATDICSVAVSNDNELLILKEETGKGIHSSRLAPMIREAVTEAGFTLSGLSGIGVSKGPGSYTGLRIGVATAKGLAFALDIPLFGINTLEAMAENVRSRHNTGNALLCPMLDARRMEVYYLLMDPKGNIRKKTGTYILEDEAFKGILRDGKVLFFGPGMPKGMEVLRASGNAGFVRDINPSAAYISPLTVKEFHSGNREDLDTFEPFYLKDFVAIRSKKIDSILQEKRKNKSQK